MNDQEKIKLKNEFAEFEATAPCMDKPHETRQDPSQFDVHKVQANYVSNAFPGIVLAGCVYPFLMGVAILFFEVVFNGATNQILIGMFFVAVYGILGGAVGLIVSGFTGIISIAMLIVVNRSLGYPLNPRSAAISAGGLAGYAPTVWILFTTPSTGGFSVKVAAGFLGPVLAMILGAIGAACSSSKFGGYESAVSTRRDRFRPSIMHIMIATAWIAVTFAIANFFGGPEFSIAVAAWFVLQAFLLVVIHAFRKIALQESRRHKNRK